jgi:hypothetical protein
VAADLAARARQVLAGLVVLAVLILSLGQAVAGPISSWSSNPAHRDRIGADVGAVIAVASDLGSPCQHRDCTHGLACCIADGCPVVSVLLPADTTALAPVGSTAPARPDIATPVPAGRGLAPDLPPPRRIV